MGGKRVSLLPLLIFYISEFSPFFCVDPRIQFPRNPFFLSHRELSEAVRSNCRWDLRRIDSIKGSAWWNYSRVLWLNRKEMTLINERPAQSPVLFFLASHRATSHHEWNFRPLDDRAMRQIFDLTSLISLRTLPVTHFNRHLTLAYVPLRKECVENVNLYLNKFAAKNRRKVVFLYWKSGKVGSRSQSQTVLWSSAPTPVNAKWAFSHLFKDMKYGRRRTTNNYGMPQVIYCWIRFCCCHCLPSAVKRHRGEMKKGSRGSQKLFVIFLLRSADEILS